ncbi:MAG: glycosyltransferase family 39 protein [Bacteroidota bacterium]
MKALFSRDPFYELLFTFNQTDLNFKNKTILLILIATLVRSVAAGCIELGNDEAYYRMYAQFLQWNYFDHPPAVGWLIRATTFNLFLDNEFFIRLGAILSAAITSWLLFLCGRKLMNDYAGFLAVLIYTATLYGSIIAGIFILPDSPQMIFWSGGLYLLIDIAGYRINDNEKRESCYGLVLLQVSVCFAKCILRFSGPGCCFISCSMI